MDNNSMHYCSQLLRAVVVFLRGALFVDMEATSILEEARGPLQFERRYASWYKRSVGVICEN
eukprot:5540390-Amphidinium_carterae.1